MDPLGAAIDDINWSSLDDISGPASEAPAHLRALLDDDAGGWGDAIEYLEELIPRDDLSPRYREVCSATAPFIGILAQIVARVNTAESPQHRERQIVRASLLEFVASFAMACRFDIPDQQLEEDSRRTDAERQRLQRQLWDLHGTHWVRTKILGETPEPVPPQLPYYPITCVHDIIACRATVPAVIDVIAPLIEDADPVIRVAAANAMVHLIAHPAHAGALSVLVGRLESAGARSADPAERAAIAHLLGIAGRRSETLLADPHPGVRCCAALAPAFAGDERATRELIKAAEDPHAADNWFESYLPELGEDLSRDLRETVLARVDDFDTLLPVALGLVRSSPQIPGVGYALGFLVDRAFPRAVTNPAELTPSQRVFLAALVDNTRIWTILYRASKKAEPNTDLLKSLRTAGLPDDREDCRRILQTRGT